MLHPTYRPLGICRAVCVVAVLIALLGVGQSIQAASPLVKLLQGGKLPKERQPTVVEMVCKRGDADDLAYIFGQVLDPAAYATDLRLKTLGWLAEAARINKVKPTGDLAQIEKMLAEKEAAKNPAFALAVMQLAAVWHVPSVADELQQLATDRHVDPKIQSAAIEGLATIADAGSRATLVKLAGRANPTATRFLAVAALAGLDLNQAATLAGAALAEASPQDDPTGLILAFVDRKQGSDKLAAAFGGVQLPVDVAKRALRTMYAAGHSDPALSDVLSKAAGIATDAPPPTGDELNRIIAEVTDKGDPLRGEAVFRRGDVGCMKCHSVSGAGGQVGPDLSPLGSTSPVEYVVNSILNPNLAIKELYITKIFVTSSGQTISGIVVDRNDREVKLKNALGQILTIAAADIEEEAEGKSLMPQGLTKFLTHQEFLDLARFVSELGKPGPYALRKTPTVQRWRVLKSPASQLTAEVPNVEVLREMVFAAPDEQWLPAYGRVAGTLPLAEVKGAAESSVVYLQGTVEVTEPGKVGLVVKCSEPVQGWLDATSFEPGEKFVADLDKGSHTLTLRIAVSDKPAAELKAEFFKPAGSPAEFTAQ